MARNIGRSFNHFHNPIQRWANPGLDDWILLPPFHTTGESSILWAQDSAGQLNTPTKPGGDWSWDTIRRNYFYDALTAGNDSDRQAYFAETFYGLGHQIHLIQDASQPDHVRNHAHPIDGSGHGGIETWVEEEC